MPGKATGRKEVSPSGNLGVPVGTVLIVVCFFLPWVTLNDFTALEVSANHQKASMALGYLKMNPRNPLALRRALYLIPIVALSTLMLQFAIPPGRTGRAAARFGVLAVGAMLCTFFIYFAFHHGPKLACGFWGSLTGALFITVGALFNVFRGE